MKKICLNIEVHQPMRFQTYRFSEIENNHNYYDDYENEYFIKKLSEKYLLPSNRILSDIIHFCRKDFKMSFLFSGVVLDLFQLYAPEMIESYNSLIDTSCVDLLPGTYSNSLMPMISEEDYQNQIELQKKRIMSLFGTNPLKSHSNYSDKQSFNFTDPVLRIISGNAKLNYYSHYVISRKNQAEWLLNPKKLLILLDKFIRDGNDIINIFLRYDIYGDSVNVNSCLIEFLQLLTIEIISRSDYSFGIPEEAEINVQSESRKGILARSNINKSQIFKYKGNEFQNNAFEELYSLSGKVDKTDNSGIKKDWLYLQSADHFLFMDPGIYIDNKINRDFFPYETHFLAYINYMNILMDFSYRCRKDELERNMNLQKILKENAEHTNDSVSPDKSNRHGKKKVLLKS
jgi:alpha-amylase